MSRYFPDPNDNPELYKLFTTYQVHSHSKSCRKYKNTDCRYNFGRYFTNRTFVAVSLCRDLSEDKKNEIMQQRGNKNLNLKKCHFFDSSKDDYEQAPDILDILRELDTSENEYYDALSISSDDDFQIHFNPIPGGGGGGGQNCPPLKLFQFSENWEKL